MTHVLLTAEQAQQIEEALIRVVDRGLSSHSNDEEALSIIRAARAQEQAEQEPVGWWNGKETVWFGHELITDGPIGEFQIPLYTAPQPVSKEQVAVLDITYGREPECYATPNADDLPEGTYRLYAAPVRTKDLSDYEINQVWLTIPEESEVDDVLLFARAVIAADREKNK